MKYLPFIITCKFCRTRRTMCDTVQREDELVICRKCFNKFKTSGRLKMVPDIETGIA